MKDLTFKRFLLETAKKVKGSWNSPLFRGAIELTASVALGITPSTLLAKSAGIVFAFIWFLGSIAFGILRLLYWLWVDENRDC